MGNDASAPDTHEMDGRDETTTAQQRMASTPPVRTQWQTGHAMATSTSPAAKQSPQRLRCLQGRSTTVAGLRRQVRQARSDPLRRGSTYADEDDSAGPASPPRSSSPDARARRGLLELRVEGHGGGLLREGLRLPRRRLAAEARQPLLEFRAAPRLALRLQRLLPEPARRGSLCRDKQRPVMAPHPIGHRPPELLALSKNVPAHHATEQTNHRNKRIVWGAKSSITCSLMNRSSSSSCRFICPASSSENETNGMGDDE